MDTGTERGKAMKTRGMRMRRVTGALYGIWGMVSLFVSLVGVIQAATFNDGSFEAGDPFYRGVLIDGVIMIVILFLFSLLYITAGILGIQYAQCPEKAKFAFILGLVLMVFPVIWIIVGVYAIQWPGILFFGLARLALAICYVVGAAMNRPGKGVPAKGN